MKYRLVFRDLLCSVRRYTNRKMDDLTATRSYHRLLHDKAYVNGQWVEANSGKTFNGEYSLIKLYYTV